MTVPTNLVWLALLSGGMLAAGGPARAAGVSLDLGYSSSFGPDAYGLAHVQLLADPGLEVGMLSVGGTQPALLGTFARRVALGSAVELRGELQLGALRERGPSFGSVLGIDVHTGPVASVAEAGWLGGMGGHGQVGVDAPLSDAWRLQPRLRLESWAGQRDPALRVGLGVVRDFDRGWLGLSVSGGGRDVLHMGPGAALTVGFDPGRTPLPRTD